MQRRSFFIASLAMPAVALAHHGWSSFDQNRPVWLEGKATRVRWANPHVELELEVAPNMRVPADLATRSYPAQSAPVDAKALAQRTVVPTRKDTRWEIELAPLTRMQAWKIEEIKPGTNVGVLGFTLEGERGEPVVRAEYLFVGTRVYGLRSSPA